MDIRHNISLRSYNSFGIDVSARSFAAFTSVDELVELVSSNTIRAKEPLLILGGGSNILLTGNIDGWVLKNDLAGIKLLKEDENHYYVNAQAGENWHGFVQYCISQQYAGVENLSLIPGNVGASPMQNIGAYGVEIKDIFQELRAYDLLEKNIRHFGLADCGFGYRESVFKNRFKGRYVILDVTYRLNKKPDFQTSYGAIAQELERMGIEELSIQAVSKAVINIRSSKLPDPKQVGNAGSFFKNPVISSNQYTLLQQQYPAIPGYAAGEGQTKVAAGWLIEQCGWKGYRKGDAGCYEKQALVLVNYGKASGQEILELSQHIIDSVNDRFGINLEREVNVL
jgi:UDP-N-acetylmuramate dehydrogenase